ncbi:hypothetical protein H2200_001176 [Cladophialophora chaetospira]|uniref:Amidohydrolase-related domain-containing protein n=1 Tax=Cladophialophora chaetospira TaxID=386627 RepID=A0AA38XKD1_9EURO|nr:hypothetical protein H2200_001176 [Cladophialophora chaetospira]
MLLSSALITLWALTTTACDLPAHIQRRADKTAITNVHVYDGTQFSTDLKTVVIVGGLISSAAVTDAPTVDGQGGYLAPGFIDSHCHLTSCSFLTPLRQYGITTGLDMGTFPYSSLKACRANGATDVRGPGPAATVNGSAISGLPGYPTSDFIPNSSAAAKFVAKRVVDGVDYIKVFLDPAGPDAQTLSALVSAAHIAGKLVIAHATTVADYQKATAAKVDILTHVPVDAPLDAATVNAIKSNGQRVVPTLFMMKSILTNTGAPPNFYVQNAQESLSRMYKAGIPVATGTDANNNPFIPANPPFGESLHEEFELLVQAGVSTKDVINGATSIAASTFRINDRGAIKLGQRADLVLLGANPLTDITNSRSIKKVWVQGVSS